MVQQKDKLHNHLHTYVVGADVVLRILPNVRHKHQDASSGGRAGADNHIYVVHAW